MAKPPASLRDTMRLFGKFRPARGLAEFFLRPEWSGLSGRHLAHALLDRPPAAGEEWPDGGAQVVFESAAFRDRLCLRLARALPNKRRLLFVHLPKCAGTDFEGVLRRRMPLLHPTIESAAAVPPEQLAAWLRRLAEALADSETIAYGGHTALPFYLDEGLFRVSDRIVTVIREPRAIIISFANYIMARFDRQPDLAAIDTRGWADMLGITSFDPAMPAAERRAMALRVMTTPGILPVNPLCALLGDGTAAGAMAQLARAPVEFTTVERYEAWLAARFPGTESRRANAQPALIGWDDLSSEQRRQLEAATEEDRPLYDDLMQKLGDQAFAFAA